MAKYQYRITGEATGSSTSGTALFAFINKLNSGRKITVQSIELSNYTLMGKMATLDTQNACPTYYGVMKCTAIDGGLDITTRCAKLDSNFPEVGSIGSAPIVVKTNAQWAADLLQWGTTSYTDATVAVGDTVFTPGTTPSPAWIANEHRDRYFVIASGGNAGTYLITANAATTLTLDPPLVAIGSTTGYIAEYPGYVRGILKSITSALTNFNFINCIRGIELESLGSIFNKRRNSADIQPLVINADEKYALVLPRLPNNNNAGYISCTFQVINGANTYTYVVDIFAAIQGEKLSLLSFENPSGSGNTIKIVNITFTEVGSHDTPYFQAVPISGIEATSYNDPEKKVSVVKSDTAFPDLASSIAEIFTNVPLYPYNVPFSYFSEGSPGVPKGFNYLATKDFIGPVYCTLFPENNAYKLPLSSTNLVPGTFGTHVGMDTSVMRNRVPIVVREGEGFAIVSGAETAAGAVVTGVPHASIGRYEIGITFTVENATTPSLVLTGLQNNSEVRVYDHTTLAALAGIENTSGGTFSWEYDYTPGQTVDIVIHHLNYQYIRLTNIALSSTGLSIPIQQQIDRNYANP